MGVKANTIEIHALKAMALENPHWQGNFMDFTSDTHAAARLGIKDDTYKNH